ncbi:MAG: FtsX-like permease family protein, partial [Paracoccaceae bacterium]
TGTPWDRAILLPIESVWQVHGLATGHAPDRVTQMGPPFDAAFMPGVPVVVVKAASLPATYAVQSRWQSDARTMAVFPGAVLSGLYRVMGDVRVAMSAISSLAQGLVAASILAGLLILLRLLRRQLVLLRVLGAPARFVLAVVWSYCALLLAIGTLVGLAAGVGLAAALSNWVSGETGVIIYATIGWTELHLTAAFLSVVAVLSLLPGWVVSRNANMADLRS